MCVVEYMEYMVFGVGNDYGIRCPKIGCVTKNQNPKNGCVEVSLDGPPGFGYIV